MNAPVRPRLTMPPDEAAALRGAYEGARVILEYGAGGSTALAAEMADKRIFTVESDAEFLRGLKAWFKAHPPRSEVVLHHADIGPTREWGYPQDSEMVEHWPAYPNSVWSRADFEHPDVVLVDGRFRCGCFLTTLFRITRPVTLYWDDYTNRPAYHRVEKLAAPAAAFGRMVRFDLVPTPIPAERLGWIIETYLRAQ